MWAVKKGGKWTFNRLSDTYERPKIVCGLTSKGEKFNIFRVCGVDHYETTHSAILAEFLNPKGGHGKETKYLHLFLNMLKEKGLPFPV